MIKEIIYLREYGEKMNKKILQTNNKNIKRFYAIDHQIYKKGALDKKSKRAYGSCCFYSPTV